MKKTAIAFIVPVLGAFPAFAGDLTSPAQASAPAAPANNTGLSPYIGFSGAFGEQSETVIASALGGDGTYDVEGLRVNGGLGFGNGFSIDGRYEFLEGDLYGNDIDSGEIRALVNYEQELTEGLSIVGGLGYGWLSHEASVGGVSLDLSGDGLLLNAGAKFSSGQIFGTLVYTHCFTESAELEISGSGELDGSFEADGGDLEDVGSLEATIGYNITEQFAATLSWEAQVTGDTWIEKDWVAAIGFQYKF
jgi:hypothetical protein